jgi:hypothetical protein
LFLLPFYRKVIRDGRFKLKPKHYEEGEKREQKLLLRYGEILETIVEKIKIIT